MLQRLFLAAIDWVLPPRCAGCGAPGAAICGSCLVAFPPAPAAFCLRCTAEIGAGCQCSPAVPVVALTRFHTPLPEIIHAFKYNGQFGLARPLSAALADFCRQLDAGLLPDRPLLVPIPLHASRQKMRGYNQSERLAHHLAREMGWAHCPAGLRRTRPTDVQARLSAAERRQNVEQAFAAQPALVSGQTIVLIDDVCTTGSTLAAAAAALQQAGAKTVQALCLARA